MDILHNYLIDKKILNFFIEIGGEVRANGKNIKNVDWIVGIESPFKLNSNTPIATASLEGLSIATSGNYRNFYKIGDSLIFHTIDPRTGYPSETNMLSASVFSTSCLPSTFVTICDNRFDALLTPLAVLTVLAKEREDGDDLDLDVLPNILFASERILCALLIADELCIFGEDDMIIYIYIYIYKLYVFFF